MVIFGLVPETPVRIVHKWFKGDVRQKDDTISGETPEKNHFLEKNLDKKIKTWNTIVNSFHEIREGIKRPLVVSFP